MKTIVFVLCLFGSGFSVPSGDPRISESNEKNSLSSTNTKTEEPKTASLSGNFTNSISTLPKNFENGVDLKHLPETLGNSTEAGKETNSLQPTQQPKSEDISSQNDKTETKKIPPVDLVRPELVHKSPKEIDQNIPQPMFVQPRLRNVELPTVQDAIRNVLPGESIFKLPNLTTAQGETESVLLQQLPTVQKLEQHQNSSYPQSSDYQLKNNAKLDLNDTTNDSRQVTNKRDTETSKKSSTTDLPTAKPSTTTTSNLEIHVEEEQSSKSEQNPIPPVNIFNPGKFLMDGLLTAGKNIKSFADSQLQTAQSAVQETAQNIGDFAVNGFSVAQKTAADSAKLAEDGLNTAREDTAKQTGNFGSLAQRQLETTGKVLGQTVGNFGKLVTGGFGTARDLSEDVSGQVNGALGQRWGPGTGGGGIMRGLGGLFGGLTGRNGGGFLFSSSS